jgi:subtilase family serine protease
MYYGYGRIDARRAIEMAAQVRELMAYEWRTPPYLEPNSTGIINATVLNFGCNNEANVTVQLLANGTLVDSAVIDFLASGSTAAVSLTWNPTVEGAYNLTFFVVPVPSEMNLENNVLSKRIDVGYPLKAVVLHSAGNVLSETIANWQVLNSEWREFGNILIYIDYTTLNKGSITYADIVSTGAAVLIISCAYDPLAGWQFTDSETEAIEQYVQEGHGLVATAGTFFYDVPNNNKLAPLFGLNESVMWDTGITSLLQLSNTSHPLFRNIPNPLMFPNVGTAVPFDRKWDLNELAGGEYLALGDYEESAIIAYRNLVYISPWLEVIPTYYRDHLQLFYNAITLSSYKKPQHELVVSLEAPRYLQRGQSAKLRAKVYNMGLSNETNVELYLLIDSAIVNSTIIPELLVGESKTVDFLWFPSIEKVYDITAYSPPVWDEELVKSNFDSALVYVRFVMFVLWDETKDGDGDSLTGKYRSLYLLLTENGFIVDTLTTGPIDYSILANYDIFVLMDPEFDFWSSEISDIQNWIASGGALITMPDGGYPLTMDTLLAPFGVRLTGREGSYGATTNIESHPITQCVNSIWVNLVREIFVTSPSTTLARTTEFLAFLSSTEDGKVIVLSDSNIMDNDGIVREDNAQLTLNIFNWVGTKAEHDVSVRLDAPAFLNVGEEKILTATVRNRGLSNETDVPLYLLINDTVVDSILIPQLLAGRSYTLTYLWIPLAQGEYNVTTYVSPVPDEALLTNNIVVKSVYVSHTGGTYLFVDPLESKLLIGETLSMNIEVAYVVNLYGWQTRLYYNSTVLKWINATYPPGHVFDGEPFVPVVPFNGSDEKGTFIMFFACLAGKPVGFSGSGALCQISFEAVSNGTSELLFSRPLGWEGDTWLIDPSLNDIPFSAFDGMVEVVPVRDIAIVDVKPSVREAYQKWAIQVNVTVQNKGGSSESFTVKLYYDNVTIATQTVTNLAQNENLTLIFYWNVSELSFYVNYTLWAESIVLMGEANTDNNRFVDGVVIVKKLGDVNGDRDVNGLDLAFICKAFASDPNSVRWNPDTDLNQDSRIDGKDIALCVKNFPW